MNQVLKEKNAHVYVFLPIGIVPPLFGDPPLAVKHPHCMTISASKMQTDTLQNVNGEGRFLCTLGGARWHLYWGFAIGVSRTVSPRFFFSANETEESEKNGRKRKNRNPKNKLQKRKKMEMERKKTEKKEEPGKKRKTKKREKIGSDTVLATSFAKSRL